MYFVISSIINLLFKNTFLFFTLDLMLADMHINTLHTKCLKTNCKILKLKNVPVDNDVIMCVDIDVIKCEIKNLLSQHILVSV